MKLSRLVCPAIVGPTAVGKTGLVTRLAAEYPLEVISLDSRQIYRGLKIGTAQPTAAELAVCPHHLIDFVSPDEKYDAIRFRRDFERVHDEISRRGGLPILVGGAGMYHTAISQGFMDIPGHTPERLLQVRSELDAQSDEEIRTALHAADPQSFARIHINDRYRSQRALEIFRISGATMTSLASQQTDDPALGLSFPTFVLERGVTESDQRISQRTELMLAQGWIQETEACLQKHCADGPGLQSIGYREIVRHLAGDLARSELPAAIVLVTRQYAKRQRTMFRHITSAERGQPHDEKLFQAIAKVLSS